MLGKWYKHKHKKDVFIFAYSFYSVNGLATFRFVPEVEGIEFHPLLKHDVVDNYEHVPFEQIDKNRVREIIRACFEEQKRFDFAYMRQVAGI